MCPSRVLVAPYPMGPKETAEWAQSDAPAEATAVFPPDEPEGWPAANYRRAGVYYFDSLGRLVNTATPGGSISTTQYESYGNADWTLTAGDRQRALEAGSEPPSHKAERLATRSTYEHEGSELESRLGPEHEVKLANGTVTQARAWTKYYYDESAPSGGPYRLVTKTTEGALLESGKEEEQRIVKTSYSGQSNLGWELHKPTSVTVEPKGGEELARTTAYSPETGDVTESTAPTTSGKVEASQIIYYTPGTEASVAVCQNHPEWANLPCQTRPATQPGGGLPELPATATTYDLWGEAETVTEKSGSSTRTSTRTYDPAGRLKESAVTSSTGKSQPTVTSNYSTETGALINQSDTTEGKFQEIKSEYNTRGQLLSYRDAAGNVATYEYDEDGRIKKTSDGKGNQTFEYSETAGELTTLRDSSAGTFTATYNVEGQLASETYPNGMKATYTTNSLGQATGLTYTKGSSTWYKDQVALSIHGQWLSQQSTLANENYTYDGIGRMTQVQEEPASKTQEEAVGKGCTTYRYGYDGGSDRTSETKYGPATGGACSNEGGTTTSHSYDEAAGSPTQARYMNRSAPAQAFQPPTPVDTHSKAAITREERSTPRPRTAKPTSTPLIPPAECSKPQWSKVQAPRTPSLTTQARARRRARSKPKVAGLVTSQVSTVLSLQHRPTVGNPSFALSTFMEMSLESLPTMVVRNQPHSEVNPQRLACLHQNPRKDTAGLAPEVSKPNSLKPA